MQRRNPPHWRREASKVRAHCCQKIVRWWQKRFGKDVVLHLLKQLEGARSRKCKSFNMKFVFFIIFYLLEKTFLFIFGVGTVQFLAHLPLANLSLFGS